MAPHAFREDVSTSTEMYAPEISVATDRIEETIVVPKISTHHTVGKWSSDDRHPVPADLTASALALREFFGYVGGAGGHRHVTVERRGMTNIRRSPHSKGVFGLYLM